MVHTHINEGLIKVPPTLFNNIMDWVRHQVLWQVRDRFTPKVRAEFPQHFTAFKALLIDLNIKLPREKYPMSDDGIDARRFDFSTEGMPASYKRLKPTASSIRVAIDWKGKAVAPPSRGPNSILRAGWVANKQALILYASRMPELARYPARGHHIDNVEWSLRALGEAIEHELRHAVQYLLLKSVDQRQVDQGKDYRGADDKGYYASPIEFDPQIGSAVFVFLSDFKVLKDISNGKKLNLPKLIRQFVGAQKGSMFGGNDAMTTDAFFRALRKTDRDRWKIAVAKFYIAVKAELAKTKDTT